MAEEKRMVELPDMIRVHDWLEANKVELTCRIRMNHIPDTSDVRLTAEVNSDEIQEILLMNFCLALVKGEV